MGRGAARRRFRTRVKAATWCVELAFSSAVHSMQPPRPPAALPWPCFAYPFVVPAGTQASSCCFEFEFCVACCQQSNFTKSGEWRKEFRTPGKARGRGPGQKALRRRHLPALLHFANQRLASPARPLRSQRGGGTTRSSSAGASAGPTRRARCAGRRRRRSNGAAYLSTQAPCFAPLTHTPCFSQHPRSTKTPT